MSPATSSSCSSTRSSTSGTSTPESPADPPSIKGQTDEETEAYRYFRLKHRLISGSILTTTIATFSTTSSLRRRIRSPFSCRINGSGRLSTSSSTNFSPSSNLGIDRLKSSFYHSEKITSSFPLRAKLSKKSDIDIDQLRNNPRVWDVLQVYSCSYCHH